MLNSDRDKAVTSSGPSCKGAVAFIDWLVLALGGTADAADCRIAT